MPGDTQKRDLRYRPPNPFTAHHKNNPFTSTDEVMLVKVPEAPETHERKRQGRGYLSGSVGPLDNLFGMLDGRQPMVPRKIEVTRDRPQEKDEPEDADDEPASPKDLPPRYGR